MKTCVSVPSGAMLSLLMLATTSVVLLVVSTFLPREHGSYDTNMFNIGVSMVGGS